MDGHRASGPSLSFNKFAEQLGGEKSPATLVANKCSDTDAYFEVRFNDDAHATLDDPSKVLSLLKLTESISARNMFVFDATNAIKKYATAAIPPNAWLRQASMRGCGVTRVESALWRSAPSKKYKSRPCGSCVRIADARTLGSAVIPSR